MSGLGDGGSAFPYALPQGWAEMSPGIDLRTYIAVKAMQGLLAAETSGFATYEDVGEVSRQELIAEEAFLQADAMLKARAVQS